MSGSAPILRVARATSSLKASQHFYCEALGLQVIARFDDHEGFSGLIVGHPNAAWHLEFVVEEDVPSPRAPGAENLLVLYLPDETEFRSAVDRMQACGYEPVASSNPYWDRAGKTFEDADGYRLVIENAAWSR